MSTVMGITLLCAQLLWWDTERAFLFRTWRLRKVYIYNVVKLQRECTGRKGNRGKSSSCHVEASERTLGLSLIAWEVLFPGLDLDSGLDWTLDWTLENMYFWCYCSAKEARGPMPCLLEAQTLNHVQISW